jgi:hypothetical protein
MHVILKVFNFYVGVWEFIFKIDGAFLADCTSNLLIICPLDFAIATPLISYN